MNQMETSIQISIQAFEKYRESDYKEALKNLNIIKNGKKSNDKTTNRIQHNILICEFSLAESKSQRDKVIESLEKLIHEIETKNGDEDNKNQKMKKKDKNEQDIQEISLLKLNLGYMNYLNKNMIEAQKVLNQYFIMKAGIIQNNFIKAKAFFTLLDICVQRQDFIQAYQIYNRLLELRTMIQKEQDQYKQNQNNEKQEKEDDKFKNDNYNLILFKDQKFQYCSLICGFVIHQSGEYKLLLDLKEFQLFLDLLKVQILIHFDMNEYAQNCLKQIKKELLSISSCDSLLNPNNQSVDQQNQQLFQFVLKQVINIFKFTKSFNALKQKNFKKSIKYLNPNFELKLNINNMGTHNQIYAIFQLNNLGCVHLSLKKPILAIYYFSRALEVNLSKVQTNGQSQMYQLVVKNVSLKLDSIKYNLAQALMLTQKTQLGYQTLDSIISDFSDKYKLWYLIGSQMLFEYQQQLEFNQQNQQYDLIQDVIDDYEPTYKTNEQQSQNFRRFVLGENKDQQMQKQSSQLLIKVINSLRNCLHLFNKQCKFKHQTQDRINLINQIQQDNQLNNTKSQHNHSSSDDYNSDLETKCLFKLTYALLANQQYNAAFNTCQQAFQHQISNPQRIILYSYLLEIHLVQGRHQDAVNVINTLNKLNQQKDSINFVCQNILYHNRQQFTNIGFETMLLTNMAACELLNNQVNQAQKYIKSALYTLEINTNQFAQIPLALLNLTIYIQIVNGNHTGAINIIKRKRILAQNNSNKNMLKITK